MEIFKDYLIRALIWVLSVGIPALITYWVKSRKVKSAVDALSTALSEQEKANAEAALAAEQAALSEAQAQLEAAKNAITKELKRLVQEAEVMFKPMNEVMKRQNSSAGPLKKSHVVNSLKAFCLEHGYPWDAVEMDAAIEAEVEYTKTVNGKQ